MAKQMGGAATWAPHPGSGERSPHNVSHCGRASQPDTGRHHSKKDPSRRTHPACFANVRNKSFADVREQWQLVYEPTFAVDDDLTRTPVNVVKLERDDLSRPQAKSGQQEQDRVISAGGGRRPIRRCQHALHFLRRKERRWGGLTVPADHRN